MLYDENTVAKQHSTNFLKYNFLTLSSVLIFYHSYIHVSCVYVEVYMCPWISFPSCSTAAFSTEVKQITL